MCVCLCIGTDQLIHRPSMITPIVSFNNKFIQSLVFRNVIIVTLKINGSYFQTIIDFLRHFNEWCHKLLSNENKPFILFIAQRISANYLFSTSDPCTTFKLSETSFVILALILE